MSPLLALLGAVVSLLGRRDETVRLVERALAGEGEAVRALVHRLMPVIRARVRRLLRETRGGRLGPTDGDDLVQEAWLALLKDDGRQLRAFDPARGASLETYVGLVAERTVRNARQKIVALKRGGDRVRVEDEDAPGRLASEAPGPEDVAASRQLAGALAARLREQLPERGWLVFRCLYTDGRPVDETAALLGVDRQVVYNWQHKIRRLARAFAEGEVGA